MIIEKKTLVTALVATLLALAGTGLFAHQIFKKASQAKELSASVERSRGEEKNINAIARALQETERSREKLGEYYLKKSGIVFFIERLESMGKNAGLKTIVQNVSVPEKSAILSIGVDTEGSFEDTFYFLSLLEKLPYKLAIESVTMREKAGAGTVESATGKTEGPSGGMKALWAGSFTVAIESFINS